MKIAYDLDGVLYDTSDIILEIDNSIITSKPYNYPPTPKEKYRKHFQTKNWNKLYRDLGIREEDLEEVVGLLIKKYKNLTLLPDLIPGAIEALNLTEQAIGKENLYFITNTSENNIKQRFERDNLIHYLENARTSQEGKTKMLYNLAIKQINTPFAYVGDLVSDGEECLEARAQGAYNIQFYGIIHEYSMNRPEDMKYFVNNNKNFAKILNNLNEVNKIWSP